MVETLAPPAPATSQEMHTENVPFATAGERTGRFFRRKNATEVVKVPEISLNRFTSFANEVAQPFFDAQNGDNPLAEEAMQSVIVNMTTRLIKGTEKEAPLDLDSVSRSDLLVLGRMVSATGELALKRSVFSKIIEQFPNDMYHTTFPNTAEGKNLEVLMRDTAFLRIAIEDDIQRTSAALQEKGMEEIGPRELMDHADSRLKSLCIREVMNRGFDAAEASNIVLDWQTLSGEDIDTKPYILDNLNRLEAIAKIDAALPGRLYRERGIAHFGRYSEKLLAAQFEPLPEGVAPDFVVMARSDHNSAFYYAMSKIEEDIAEDPPRLRIAEAASVDELMQRIDGLYNGNGHKRAKNIIIGAHGNTESMRIGRREMRFDDEPYVPVLTKNAVNARLAALRQMADANGNLILVSCSTGAEGAIAENANEASGLATLAPKIPANIESVNRLPDGRLDVKYWDPEAKNTGVHTVTRHLQAAA